MHGYWEPIVLISVVLTVFLFPYIILAAHSGIEFTSGFAWLFFITDVIILVIGSNNAQKNGPFYWPSVLFGTAFTTATMWVVIIATEVSNKPM